MNGQDAELVLRGGMIYTVDAARSWAQAVAVRGGTIVAVGTDAQIEELTGSGTLVVDLAGRMMLPGFIDAHVHASAAGLERLRCDLSEAHGLADYLAIVRRYAQAEPSGWITGGGWSIDVFPGGIPSRRDLERAGVSATTLDPADGRIERERDGTPSGTLQEGAMGLVERVIPRPHIDEQVAGIAEAQRNLHALGITGWQEAIVGDYAVVPDCFDAYLDAGRRGLLTARVVGALWWQRGLGIGQLDGLVERRERTGGTRRFRATSIKIMQDGVCENFTASMLRPYFDRHGHETNGSGSSFFAAGELKEAVTAIDARGFQVHFHAIGDRAVREALDAVAAARAANGAGDGRHHISHIQVVHPQDLPRFRELGVLANCQPLWACEEPQMTELTLPFLGPERSWWQYPFGSLLRSGAQLCFGSDWPVSSPNPLWELHTAVNRTVPPGYPYAGPGD